MSETLSISSQQLVEIAKALTLDCQILILDEPTAALTEREAQVLFGIMHSLAARGISIIYISHRMVEIFEHCDRVSVFRDGKRIMTEDVSKVTTDDIVNSMVGRVIGKLYPPKQTAEERSEEVLFTVAGLGDGKRFRDVSFVLRKGEILGIAGLIGAGRSEIVKGICGLEASDDRRDHAQRPTAPARHVSAEHRQRRRLSVRRPQRRRRLPRPVDRRPTSRRSTCARSRRGGAPLIADARASRPSTLGDRLSLKRGSIEQPVSSLSGGNQQKVAIAKMLSVNPRIIFLDEPTRGVDVGAKAEIHRILRDLARSGVGVVVVSSELPELIGLCDRVLVVREGLISGEVDGDALTEENIMRLASFTERAIASPSADRRPN